MRAKYPQCLSNINNAEEGFNQKFEEIKSLTSAQVDEYEKKLIAEEQKLNQSCRQTLSLLDSEKSTVGPQPKMSEKKKHKKHKKHNKKTTNNNNSDDLGHGFYMSNDSFTRNLAKSLSEVTNQTNSGSNADQTQAADSEFNNSSFTH